MKRGSSSSSPTRLVFIFKPPHTGPFLIRRHVSKHFVRIIVYRRAPIPLSLDWMPRDLRMVLWSLLDDVDRYVIRNLHGVIQKNMNVPMVMDCIHNGYHKLLRLFGTKRVNSFVCCRATTHKVIKTLRKMGWLRHCNSCVQHAIKTCNVRVLQEFTQLDDTVTQRDLLGVYHWILTYSSVDWRLVLDWLHSKGAFPTPHFVRHVIWGNRLEMMEYMLQRNLLHHMDLAEMCIKAGKYDMLQLIQHDKGFVPP